MDNDEREQVIESIEDYFLYLGASDVDFSDFQGSYPIGNGLLGGCDTLGYIDRNPKLSGFVEPWWCRASFISNGEFHAYEVRSIHWTAIARSMNHYRRVGGQKAVPDARWRTSTDFECFSKMTCRVVGSNGKLVRKPVLLWGHKGGNWYLLSKEDRHWKRLAKGNEILVSMVGMEPTYWIARVKIEPKVPSLSLITDPIGVRELWKFRDIRSGRTRRDALIHWVRDHWRQSRTDEQTEIYVREHLRGNDLLSYRGMEVQILPSREDTVKNFISKCERDEMRRSSPRDDRRTIA